MNKALNRSSSKPISSMKWGHILGVGSYTEKFTEYSEEYQGNVLKVPNSMAAQKYNQIYGNSYQYVQSVTLGVLDDIGYQVSCSGWG